jgi:putative acetyltransferase
MQLRPETPADQPGVRAVHLAAFEGPDEADLVDRLRGSTFPYVSLVAVDKGRIVGHILLTPVLLPATRGPA